MLSNNCEEKLARCARAVQRRARAVVRVPGSYPSNASICELIQLLVSHSGIKLSPEMQQELKSNQAKDRAWRKKVERNKHKTPFPGALLMR